MRLSAAYDAAIIREQGGIYRIVGGDTGEAIEDLDDGKRIAHEIEQLGREQVDDLGLDVTVARIEFGEQALCMGLDVRFVFVEQRLEIEPQTAAARNVEAEKVEATGCCRSTCRSGFRARGCSSPGRRPRRYRSEVFARQPAGS